MQATNLPLANPAPLGLFGFAMTTILLNIHNAGFYELTASIMMMGLIYGGLAQLIAGILEFKKNNTFGMVAFVSYGSFWITLVGIWMFEGLGMPGTSSFAMGCYLGIWGLLTFVLFIGTLTGKTIGKLIFGSLTILFALLAAANFTGSHLIHTIAGYEGIVCGFFAFYEASALIINEKFGRTVLPL